ncbi:MAG: hypothetical protein CMM01_16935 [Rhodopirellula sp.]|nr:hypothetical protein [Rhodopirellula sp.]
MPENRAEKQSKRADRLVPIAVFVHYVGHYQHKVAHSAQRLDPAIRTRSRKCEVSLFAPRITQLANLIIVAATVGR